MDTLKSKTHERFIAGLKGSRTRRRRSLWQRAGLLLTSLAVHFIAALIGTVFLVKTVEMEEDAIVAELVPASKAHVKRRPMARPAQEVKAPVFKAPTLRSQRPIATAAQIPTGDARFTLPAGNLMVAEAPQFFGGGARALMPRRTVQSERQAPPVSVLPTFVPPQPSAEMLAKFASPTHTLAADLALQTTTLGGSTHAPRFLHKAPLEYPDRALQQSIAGTVWLEATIDENGISQHIKVIESVGFGCDEAAIAALKASRFLPARQDDKPIAIRIKIPYRFRLED